MFQPWPALRMHEMQILMHRDRRLKLKRSMQIFYARPVHNESLPMHALLRFSALHTLEDIWFLTRHPPFHIVITRRRSTYETRRRNKP